MRTTWRLPFHLSQFLLLLPFAACASPRAAFTGTMAWSFDDVPAGRLPAGFAVAATRRVGPLASWEVAESAGAPSGRQALSLSYPNHKSYDSFNLCWNGSLAFRDGAITVKLCARSGREDQGGGLIWRASGPDDYFVARLNPLEGNLRLYHVLAGNRTMLASADCKAVAGTWYELRIEQRGERIRCAVDGAVLIEAAAAVLPEPGGVGVWTKADAATDFDDLRVEGAGP
ncbi:MAG: hypothetical protein FJ265_12075 [Planctomycetes bacterium]|nr:hypothetical protein [Planctomycetota bacterium]